MSHSKRNTSRPVFTSHERALAKSNWSSNSARLSRDSFLPFGSCGLCLGIASDPVACRRGDIFCRECALSNILTQKKEIKRIGKARQQAQEEAAKIQALEDQENRERAVKDFELTQAGLERTQKQSNPQPTSASEDKDAPALTANKRKFELDEDELERIVKDDRVKARKAIDDEKAAKPTLPSFWTPSLTPDVQTSKLPASTRKEKTTPTCPASVRDEPHPISMQNLITINFREEADSTSKDKKRICPSCLKVLSNSSSPMMVKQCGHVLCQSCIKKFILLSGKRPTAEEEPPLACFVCDIPLTSQPRERVTQIESVPGLVSLRSEGTGFSARGTSTVERSGVAFQC